MVTPRPASIFLFARRSRPVKTVDAWLRGLRCVSSFAVLAIGFAWLTPAGAGQAQDDVKKASSLDKKRETLQAELEEIRQALKKTQADLERISQQSDALKKKRAELAATEADLKKRADKIRESLEKLEPEPPGRLVFPPPNPSLNKPIIIIFPLPKPPPPRPWPPPWPPPGIFPSPPGPGIIPFGTPGGPMGALQSMSPRPGMMPQR
jgi:hypothetical protein